MEDWYFPFSWEKICQWYWIWVCKCSSKMHAINHAIQMPRASKSGMKLVLKLKFGEKITTCWILILNFLNALSPLEKDKSNSLHITQWKTSYSFPSDCPRNRFFLFFFWLQWVLNQHTMHIIKFKHIYFQHIYIQHIYIQCMYVQNIVSSPSYHYLTRRISKGSLLPDSTCHFHSHVN